MDTSPIPPITEPEPENEWAGLLITHIDHDEKEKEINYELG